MRHVRARACARCRTGLPRMRVQRASARRRRPVRAAAPVSPRCARRRRYDRRPRHVGAARPHVTPCDCRPARSGRARVPDRVDLQRRVRARGSRVARRPARDDALARGRRTRTPLSGRRRRSERAVRRQRAHPDVGRRGGRSRPVPAHDPGRLRRGGCRRRRTQRGGAARARRRAGAVHRAGMAGRHRRAARPDGLAPGEPAQAAHARRDGPQGIDERAHADAALPGTDRHVAAAMAADRARPACAAVAGGHGTVGRACRDGSGIRFGHRVSRAVRAHRRHVAAAVSSRVPRTRRRVEFATSPPPAQWHAMCRAGAAPRACNHRDRDRKPPPPRLVRHTVAPTGPDR